MDPMTDADTRDLALVHAFRAGDQAALAELLERYQDRLFGVCLRMVNDGDLAQDMVQEAMVKIIHGLPQFSGRSKLSTWMIRVTMNVCLTWRRKQRLRRHASLDAVSSGTGGGAEAGVALHASLADGREPGAEGRVEQMDARRRLKVGLSQIEPQQRAILILRDVQGFDYREIAAILAIPEGTVKSRLFRARVALREAMERLEGAGPAGDRDAASPRG
ncbi:MAG: RNA polymerase sigma factor [Phycisphaerales bacterium]|nr:RNA polymerase sigma factor [Phycisphaerales bacterium]